MNVADQRYFKRWLDELGELNPEKLWQELVATNELLAIDFSNAVSESTQPNIEGNPIDFNSYLGSKFKGRGIVQARDRRGDVGG